MRGSSWSLNSPFPGPPRPVAGGWCGGRMEEEDLLPAVVADWSLPSPACLFPSASTLKHQPHPQYLPLSPSSPLPNVWWWWWWVVLACLCPVWLETNVFALHGSFLRSSWPQQLTFCLHAAWAASFGSVRRKLLLRFVVPLSPLPHFSLLCLCLCISSGPALYSHLISINLSVVVVVVVDVGLQAHVCFRGSGSSSCCQVTSRSAQHLLCLASALLASSFSWGPLTLTPILLPFYCLFHPVLPTKHICIVLLCGLALWPSLVPRVSGAVTYLCSYSFPSISSCSPVHTYMTALPRHVSLFLLSAFLWTNRWYCPSHEGSPWFAHFNLACLQWSQSSPSMSEWQWYALHQLPRHPCRNSCLVSLALLWPCSLAVLAPLPLSPASLPSPFSINHPFLVLFHRWLMLYVCCTFVSPMSLLMLCVLVLISSWTHLACLCGLWQPHLSFLACGLWCPSAIPVHAHHHHHGSSNQCQCLLSFSFLLPSSSPVKKWRACKPPILLAFGSVQTVHCLSFLPFARAFCLFMPFKQVKHALIYTKYLGA